MTETQEEDWPGYWSITLDYIEYTYKVIHDYVDLHYLEWLAWVTYPLIVTFLLPIVIFVLLYASALFCHCYKLRHLLKDAYDKRDVWEGAKKILSIFWKAQGKIWHGYEIIGLEKIPEKGPALLIYYHGALPIDMYYMIAECILYRGRSLKSIGDRFLFMIPGMSLFLDVFGVIPGTVNSGVQIMKDGHILSIAPGGVREAYFSDEFYKPLWGKRHGFAKIAIEAKVPIIPMFTQNCREAFRAVSIGRSWFRKLYEKTRLPLVPIYGMFPVKLRTFIGDPIPYDPEYTPEQLGTKVQSAIEELIHKHQRIPGNIVRALLERFYTPAHCKTS